MDEYFRGWKKKVSCLTLVMARAAMGGWVNSLSMCNGLGFGTGSISHILSSDDGCIRWERYCNDPATDDWTLVSPVYLTPEQQSLYVENFGDNFFRRVTTGWKWDWWGFKYGEWSIVGNGQASAKSFKIKVVFFPYWSIVIPLTLVSFLLLLSKPRKSTLKTITEPDSVEGT